LQAHASKSGLKDSWWTAASPRLGSFLHGCIITYETTEEGLTPDELYGLYVSSCCLANVPPATHPARLGRAAHCQGLEGTQHSAGADSHRPRNSRRGLLEEHSMQQGQAGGRGGSGRGCPSVTSSGIPRRLLLTFRHAVEDLEAETMAIQYMDNGFGPHLDRGFATAKTRLEPGGLGLDRDGETEKHSRAMVEHVLAQEPERVPAITAELFAEAIAVADAVREAQGRGPVTSFRARDFWEILKDLIDSVLEQ
jgi:hypothetical protein